MIEYKYGDLLGENKHKFIKETKVKKMSRGGNSKYKLTLRYALFECGLCGNEFENIITKIKNDNVLSCGCLRLKNLQKYHNSKDKKW